jgi:hypothetical protein
MPYQNLIRIFILTAFLAVFTQGCGGVNSRIKDHQREFATYPPEVQGQIQNGRIDRGFTEQMVYLAKGEPDERTTAKLGAKSIVVWKYARHMPSAPPGQAAGGLSTPYGYPTFGPGPTQPTPLFYEKSYFKVEFDKGKVIGWDQDMQD